MHGFIYKSEDSLYTTNLVIYRSIVQYIHASTNQDEEEVLVSSNPVGDFPAASPISEPEEVADGTLWEEAMDVGVTLEEVAAAVAGFRLGFSVRICALGI
jgi:hypothetical protein